jgi:hypothetical protein
MHMDLNRQACYGWRSHIRRPEVAPLATCCEDWLGTYIQVNHSLDLPHARRPALEQSRDEIAQKQSEYTPRRLSLTVEPPIHDIYLLRRLLYLCS